MTEFNESTMENRNALTSKMAEESTASAEINDDVLGNECLHVSDSEDSQAEYNATYQRANAKPVQDSVLNEGKEDANVKQEEVEIKPMSDTNIFAKTAENELLNFKITKKNLTNLIDSESEGEFTSNYKNHGSNVEKQFKKVIVSSDDDEYEGSVQRNEMKKLKRKKKKKHHILNSDEDHDSEEEEMHSKTMFKLSKLIDSESSQSDNNNNDQTSCDEDNDNENELPQQVENISKKVKPKPRASAKNALDGMMTIQSEQQRLHREAYINVPYHQPKKHTLHEFLKRRSNIKGNNIDLAQIKNPKMSEEELKEYAQLMEKRANEAIEFFKSESETELHDNENIFDTLASSPPITKTLKEDEVLEKQIVNENYQQISDEIEKSLSIEHMEIVKNEEHVTESITIENNVNNKQSCLAKQIEKLKDRENKGLPVITEVLLLPRWDKNNVQAHASSDVQKIDSTTSPRFFKSQQRAQCIKHLLETKQIIESPTIKGEPDKIINLETGDIVTKPTPGIDKLLERLMSTRKARKSQNADTVSLISTENGKVEINVVPLNINTDNEDMGVKEQKPGVAFLKLKENLKSIVKNKRLEEIKKKQQYQLQNQEKYDNEEKEENIKCLEGKEDNEDTKLNNNEPIPKVSEYDVEETYESENEDDYENLNKGKIENEEHDENEDDDENEEDEYENEEHDNKVSDKDEIDTLLKDKGIENESKKKKTRFSKVFVNDSEDDDEIDLMKTQSQSNKLTEEQLNVSFDMESGINALPAIISQIPITQAFVGIEGNEDVLEALCSGTFDTEHNRFPEYKDIDNEQICESKSSRLLLSTDEEENETDNNYKNRPKKMKKPRERQRYLQLSDTDDDTEDQITQNDANSRAGDAEKEDTFVDYDSEENEIVVKMDKNERRMRAENFVEYEAELSESDWGSADEDENNLDQYDIELGDEDEFDREKIHHELKQIHARKMLDEDLREVRKLQEMLLEDEEKDGVGRERRFKWKNAEGGFSLDDSKHETPQDTVGSEDEEINEHNWRKIRFEREQLLLEQHSRSSSNVPHFDVESTQKMQKFKNALKGSTTTQIGPSDHRNTNSAFLIPNVEGVKKGARASFLIRDKDTLSKIAGLKKSTNIITIDDEPETITSVKSHKRSNNFVFTTLTAEEHELQTLKRKVDIFNNSSENETNIKKRLKTDTKQQKCLIDQLL